MILPEKHNANNISKQLFDEEDGVTSDGMMIIKYVTVHLMEIMKQKKNELQATKGHLVSFISTRRRK